MDSNFTEWLSLLGRWAHIIFGIAWIGSSFFFNWLDIHFKPPQSPNKGVTGELFLVHGGGYYQIQKKLFGSEKTPGILHWFKWEAAWTLISGYFLLGLIYYSTSGNYLIDTDVSSLTHGEAVLLSMGTLVLSWFLYDGIWRFFGQRSFLPHLLTFFLILGASSFFVKNLSGRAAYIHLGIMLATWMVLNVWVHIIPAQKKMLQQAEEGATVDHSLGKHGANRSKQNNYFTLPVIFTMISHHYPQTYGHELLWPILLLLITLGVLIRHYFNIRHVKDKRKGWILIVVGALVITLISLTRPPSIEKPSKTMQPKAILPEVQKKDIKADVDPITKAAKVPVKEAKSAELFDLTGTVYFKGSPPETKVIRLPKKCKSSQGSIVYDNRVLVQKGKLKNAIVWVLKGHEQIKVSPPPLKPFELDQKDCIYKPRVAAVRAGQPVTFINSDSFFHNVKTKAKLNKSFNIGMPKKDSRITKTFLKEEIVIKAKCSVHPWMRASIAVFKHPFFSMTDQNGSFKIKGLPKGSYTVRSWHEVYGVIDQTISLPKKGGNTLSFSYENK
ncbi:MAG: hypothetical protein CME68_03680 [Halobacteriovoraceae bacterium]|nr:hypothetical protein [Halobacteriovoraceae bacterium]